MVESNIEQIADETSLLCHKCFRDPGLQFMAASFEGETTTCPNCGTGSVYVLTRTQLMDLSHVFFVRGTIARGKFGGAPAVQFNDVQTGCLKPGPSLAHDVDLLQRTLRIGFFYYGPRLWMLGEIEPLHRLRTSSTQAAEIDRIISEYPVTPLTPEQTFFRVRKAPCQPEKPEEFDAPPQQFAGRGRLDTKECPVLYGSQDLEICVHECRFAAGDELYAATLAPCADLRLLDLSALLNENCIEFESLDLAVLMLFLAAGDAYSITRAIARAAQEKGFDGISYTSHFSLLRTGGMPFETAYGLSLRRFETMADYERSKIIPNIALFGHPIKAGKVRMVGSNRLVINRVAYGMSFGPVTY